MDLAMLQNNVLELLQLALLISLFLLALFVKLLQQFASKTLLVRVLLLPVQPILTLLMELLVTMETLAQTLTNVPQVLVLVLELAAVVMELYNQQLENNVMRVPTTERTLLVALPLASL
jgi:hypothetical protein